jgi:hypothetical protein
VLFQVTYTAWKNGLVGLVLHALDGTKIRAWVSDDSGWHYPSLKKKLYSGIDEVLNEIEECGKGSSFCFNAQAVVDDASGLIVAQDVVNEEADNGLLVPMIEKVEANLGGIAEETVADAGYYSPKQLLEAEDKGFDILVDINKAISPKEAKKFHKSKFTYDAAKDVFICPLGKELHFEGTREDRQGKYRERIYRCKCFKDCPERDACGREKKGRKITMGPHYQALMRQLEKQKIPEKKKELSRRKAIVERVFAFIKEVMGFRRFTVRGCEKVRTQWSLICTAYNLSKLFRLWRLGKQVFA